MTNQSILNWTKILQSSKVFFVCFLPPRLILIVRLLQTAFNWNNLKWTGLCLLQSFHFMLLPLSHNIYKVMNGKCSKIVIRICYLSKPGWLNLIFISMVCLCRTSFNWATWLVLKFNIFLFSFLYSHVIQSKMQN